jgi:2-iminobutanoate/2-iminopropanoate deaminase
MQKSILLTLCLLAAVAFPASAQKKPVVPQGMEQKDAAFSSGILSAGMLYVSGQMGTDPKTNQIPDDFDAEMKLALDRAGSILKAAGMDFGNVVSVQVYLTDVDLFPRMNAVYKTYFKEPRPARATVGVLKLVLPKAHIEISMTAHK